MPERRGKLQLVREREAEGRTREIFDEVRHALRVPGVPILYQSYAAYPDFLELHWRAFKPLLASAEFFNTADRLRGEAYTRAHNYFPIGDLCEPLDDMSFSPGTKHELGDVIDLFNFKDPLVLLIASTQLLAFDQAIPQDELPAASAEHPKFREKPVLVEENTAPPPIKRTFGEIKRVFALPALNADYKAFARWPDFLAKYWKAMKPIAQSPVYREQQRALCESSESMAKELRLSTDFSFDALESAGLGSKQIEGVVRTTRTMQNVFAGLVLNVAASKIGFEGGTKKTTTDREFAA